jgi:hypothetical protein
MNKCADEAGNQTKAIRRTLTCPDRFIGGATPTQRLRNSAAHLRQTPPISTQLTAISDRAFFSAAN